MKRNEWLFRYTVGATGRIRRNLAWAIDTRSHEGHGLIGVYWFTRSALEPHQDGIRTALFRTRAQARTALRHVTPPDGYQAFPRATVVRVQVSVRWGRLSGDAGGGEQK